MQRKHSEEGKSEPWANKLVNQDDNTAYIAAYLYSGRHNSSRM